MFKKILIANRGDNASGVAAQPKRPASAARRGN
jgi:acetyl/propionyl-CoA carboxylase alpha subunit